jgi:hypothetical protein
MRELCESAPKHYITKESATSSPLEQQLIHNIFCISSSLNMYTFSVSGMPQASRKTNLIEESVGLCENFHNPPPRRLAFLVRLLVGSNEI